MSLNKKGARASGRRLKKKGGNRDKKEKAAGKSKCKMGVTGPKSRSKRKKKRGKKKREGPARKRGNFGGQLTSFKRGRGGEKNWNGKAEGRNVSREGPATCKHGKGEGLKTKGRRRKNSTRGNIGVQNLP